MKLRIARIDDVPALWALEEQLFRSDRMARRQLRYHTDNPRAFFVVAETRGEIAGYALTMYRGGTAHLCSIAVARAAQGAGMGRGLLRAVIQDAEKRGSRVIRLEVRKRVSRVVAFYKKAGFEKAADLHRYYGDGADAIRMIKTLRP